MFLACAQCTKVHNPHKARRWGKTPVWETAANGQMGGFKTTILLTIMLYCFLVEVSTPAVVNDH